MSLRWIESIVPPAVVGPALNMYFQNLPKELCAMGPDAIGNVPPIATNQICPLKSISRREVIVPGLDHDAKIEEAAANPLTFGGALMLLAADSPAQAADLQKSICHIMLYPRKYCNFTSGEHVGPLFHRLSIDTTDAVGQWLLEKTVPVALAPLGMSLQALPDILCKLPNTTLAKIPQDMRWDLCPYDVSLVPVMTMFVLGRTGSGNLHAKLCDLLKRPTEACVNGRYQMSADTEDRIEEFKQRSNVLLSSLQPRVQLPDLSLPDFMTAASKGPLNTISDWWVNQTMPVIRRTTIMALIPPNLQPPAAALLERLPASICRLSLKDVANLPWMFKREVCPLSGLLKPHDGDPTVGLQSWAVTLAEVTMGAASRNNATSAGGRARADSWVARMCSTMYAPEASCGGENSTELASNATTLAVARIAEDYKPTTVKLLTSTLDAMPVGLRKQLTDGLAKQVDLVPPLVGMLPTQVKNVFLSTLCYVATPLPTLEVDPSAPLLQHVAAGKAYSNEGRDLLALLVGDSKAAAIMKTVCDAAPKPRDPPASNGTEPSTPVSSAISYVKGAFGSGYSLFQGARARVGSGITMLQGAAFQAGLLQGAASKLVMNLLPSRAQA